MGHGISRLYAASDSQQTRLDDSIASIEELSSTIDSKLSELQDHVKQVRSLREAPSIERLPRSITYAETEIEGVRNHLQQQTQRFNRICTGLDHIKRVRICMLDWRMTAVRQKAEEFREEQRVRHRLAKRLASLVIGGAIAVLLAMTFLSTIGGWIMMFGNFSEAAA